MPTHHRPTGQPRPAMPQPNRRQPTLRLPAKGPLPPRQRRSPPHHRRRSPHVTLPCRSSTAPAPIPQPMPEGRRSGSLREKTCGTWLPSISVTRPVGGRSSPSTGDTAKPTAMRSPIPTSFMSDGNSPFLPNRPHQHLFHPVPSFLPPTTPTPLHPKQGRHPPHHPPRTLRLPRSGRQLTPLRRAHQPRRPAPRHRPRTPSGPSLSRTTEQGSCFRREAGSVSVWPPP